MIRLVQAWGGTVLGTLVGFVNAIAVTRTWNDADAADFFLVPVIILALAVIAEFGLGELSVHDVARLDDRSTQQAYVNMVLFTMARRAVAPGLAAAAIAWLAVDLDQVTSIAVGAVTVLTTVALAGQPLLRGLDRRVIASVGGPIASTILTGAAVVPMAIAGSSVPPLIGALVGYGAAGVLTTLVLIRPTKTHTALDPALVSMRRSRFVAGHNVANMAGRQVDTLLAGWFMTDALFTGYAVTIRMAAPLGLIAFAGNQAAARDMHRIVDHDDAAIRHARPIYRLTAVAAAFGAVGLVSFGTPLGRVVFGDEITIRVGVLAIVAGGYLVSVLGAAGGMLLAAGDRTRELLMASVAALIAAFAAAGALLFFGLSEWAAPTFIATWLVVNTALAAGAVRSCLGLSAWSPNFGSHH